jgi:hypothetical protein
MRCTNIHFNCPSCSKFRLLTRVDRTICITYVVYFKMLCYWHEVRHKRRINCTLSNAPLKRTKCVLSLQFMHFQTMFNFRHKTALVTIAMFVEAFNLTPETRNVTCIRAYFEIQFVPHCKHVPCRLQDTKRHTPRHSTQTTPRPLYFQNGIWLHGILYMPFHLGPYENPGLPFACFHETHKC